MTVPIHFGSDGQADLEGWRERQKLIDQQTAALREALGIPHPQPRRKEPSPDQDLTQPRRGNGIAMAFSLLVQRDGPTCYLCRKNTATEIEHIVPRSRGGTDEAANLALACSGCNLRKASSYVSLDVTSGLPRYHLS